MIRREQYTAGHASAAQFWLAHVNALDRHLSAKRWALSAVTVVAILYPMARIAIPAALNSLVPDVVRTVLHLI